MKKNRKALVTGGAGFIGSNLAKKLVVEDWYVTVVDDMSNGHEEFLEDVQCDFLQCDFSDGDILERVHSKKYDVIFHLAAVPRVSYSVEEPHETDTINVNKTVQLMEAARSTGTRFVFSSSSSVYGNANSLPTNEMEPKKFESPYALQKSIIEDYATLFNKLYSSDIVCLRYFNVFGPNQYGDSPYSTAISAWCHAMKDGRPLRSDGDGEQTRDLVFVDNVVDANILVANHEKKFAGECYNVGYGDRISNNDILEYMTNSVKEKNKDIKIEIVHAPERAGDVKHTLADISKLEELGYRPKVGIYEGINKTLEWWGLI